MDFSTYRAAICDMDGVITRTADVHARAWKQMFDEYLEQRGRRGGQSYPPFELESDYLQYVDGKPRYDGVRSFLNSREIKLPQGDPQDDPAAETICGLGNRKNQLFQQMLQQHGVELYEDTLEQIDRWKQQGWKVAVISSSRNCPQVLEAAGADQWFDARVDGNDSARLGLAGKPAPDIFLRAAQLLGVRPSEAIVVEDAMAGVEAARAGKFGLVVGVARHDDTDALQQAGADIVVRDLRELHAANFCPPGHNCLATPVSAIEHRDWIAGRLHGRTVALFLDYDGTLTPIVRRPEEAQLSEPMRNVLRELAEHYTVAIVSGRDRQDVEQMVRLDNLYYAGSHGFDIRGPDGFELQREEASKALPDLDTAQQQLEQRLQPIAGARVERKKFAIAVHYREVADNNDIKRLEQTVDEVLGQLPTLRKMGGKKIFELQPDVPWDKGRAVLALRKTLGLDHTDAVTIYIGDDVTDEDALRALRRLGVGIGIRVAPPGSDTSALYYLHDCDEVQQLLQSLLEEESEKVE